MNHLEKHLWLSCVLLALPFILPTMAQSEGNITEQINESEGYLQLNYSGLDVWSHTWNISVDEGYVIQLAVLKFTNSGDGIQTLSICNCTGLEIFDGPEINARRILYSSCDQSDPGYNLLTSTANNLLVNVTSFGCSTDNIFFKAFYKAVNTSQVNRTCGGVFSEMDGNFTSPGFPSNYSDLLICEWVISADPLFWIQLWLDEIDIEMSPYNCEYDSIQVYDGGNRSSALLLRTCGNISPANTGAINSSGSSLYITFITNWNHTGRGFVARWTSVCEQTIPAWMIYGRIQSPSYLQNHQAALQCTYIMERKDSFVLKLQIYSVNLGYDNSNCLSNYAEIRSDPLEESTSIGSHIYCGNSIGGRIFVFRNSSLWIRFATNGSEPNVEFQATFFRDFHYVNYYPLTVSEGSFAMNYFEDYIWNITVEEGQVVQLAFFVEYPFCHEHITTNYFSCNCELFQVFEGFNIDTERSLLSACDNHINEVGLITSSTNNLRILFTTAYSRSYYSDHYFLYNYRIQIQYKSVNKTSVNRTCGQTLSSIHFSLTSPGFPSNYDNFLVCEWIIEVSENFTILLKINEFDIAGSQYCQLDSLQFRDGDNASAPLIWIGCYIGSDTIVITSRSNVLYIKFVSNWEGSGRGFSATWKMLYEQTIPAWMISGTIHSPSYLENHSAVSQCTYIFERNDTLELRLQFPTFNLGNEDMNCLSNYIEVRNDSILEPTLLGSRRYCGQNIDKQFIIGKIALRIIFATDGSLSSAGFQATFDRLPYEVSYVHLTSPEGNLPLHFDGKDQVRNITVQQGQVVQLAINYLYQNCTDKIVTDNVPCTCGLFQVFDGFEIDKEKILMSACDTYVNDIGLLTSSTNNMVFVFTGLDSELGSYSYSAFYKSVDERNVNRNCGRFISELEGNITSPDYPNNYSDLLICEWVISLDPPLTIRFWLEDMDIERSQTTPYCKYDSIEIRDGKNATSPVLLHTCGTITSGFTVNSSRSSLYVKFSTNWNVTHRGFFARWTYEIAFEKLTESEGFFESGSYIRGGLMNSWNISMEVGYAIQLAGLQFYKYCHLTYCAYNCSCAKLEIYDGLDISQENLLYRDCGRQWSDYSLLTSTTNNMLVVYASSRDCFSNYVMGFYKSVNSTQVNRNCGRFISELEGNLTSPDYPSNYSDLLICEWVISLDQSRTIRFWLEDMDIERSQTTPYCKYDSLEIRDGNNAASPLFWRTCGTIRNGQYETVNSSGSSLYVKFSTNWNVTNRGFFARWTYGNYRSINCNGKANIFPSLSKDVLPRLF